MDETQGLWHSIQIKRLSGFEIHEDIIAYITEITIEYSLKEESEIELNLLKLSKQFAQTLKL